MQLGKVVLITGKLVVEEMLMVNEVGKVRRVVLKTMVVADKMSVLILVVTYKVTLMVVVYKRGGYQW